MSPTVPIQTRRRYLKALGAGSVTVLGGCVGDGEDDGTPTSDENTETPAGDDETEALSTETPANDTTSGPTNETTPTEEETSLSELAWPMFQVDAANTGYHPTTTTPTGDVSQQWRFEIEDIETSPAIIDGTVYIGTLQNLHAVDAQTGEEQWKLEVVASSPAVDQRTVFIGTAGVVGHSSTKGVVSIDPETGEVLWGYETDGDINAPVAVAGGTVYAGDEMGAVYAVDTDSGEERWRFELEGRVVRSPTVGDDAVYITDDPFGANNVYAIDAANGDERWRFEADGFSSTPAVTDDTVYIGGDGTTYALDAESGDERWRFEAFDGESVTQVVTSNKVYCGVDQGSTGIVFALDVASGNEQWEFEPDGSISWGIGADRTVYFGTGGTIHALTADSGEQLWTLEEIAAFNSPAIVDGTIYSENIYGLTALG